MYIYYSTTFLQLRCYKLTEQIYSSKLTIK